MDRGYILNLLKDVKDGIIDENEAVSKLENLPFEDIEYARVDNHRRIRTGFPEVVYCEGKTPEQVAGIMKKLSESGGVVMGTRADEERYEKTRELLPDAVYHKETRIISWGREASKGDGRYIAVVTAGTSDIPVAEEAAVTSELLGYEARRFYDVGVAGIHRLFDCIDEIRGADVVICVAGMEGALASVIGGLVEAPVIAVPTSVGYGASFEGVTALLSMLNSCASGVSVVNIDNGFGAGYYACVILKGKEK